jgi:hypothetical protein
MLVLNLIKQRALRGKRCAVGDGSTIVYGVICIRRQRSLLFYFYHSILNPNNPSSFIVSILLIDGPIITELMPITLFGFTIILW